MLDFTNDGIAPLATRIAQLKTMWTDYTARLVEARRKLAAAPDVTPFEAAHEALIAEDQAIARTIAGLEEELTQLAAAGKATQDGRLTAEAAKKLAELSGLREQHRWTGEARRRASFQTMSVRDVAGDAQRDVEWFEAQLAGIDHEASGYGVLAATSITGVGSIARHVRRALDDNGFGDAA